MGPRTNYQVSRYQVHSKFAWAALIGLVVLCATPLSLADDESNKWYGGSALGLVALSLVSSNGRKMSRRLISETFYGCLFTFTGVFSKGGSNSSK